MSQNCVNYNIKIDNVIDLYEIKNQNSTDKMIIYVSIDIILE